MSTSIYDAAVVGGGFFGCRLALELATTQPRVLLVERAGDLMTRASFRNQARIHNGYHYPRSLLTGLRSRLNFDRFVQENPDATVDSFEKVYAVARSFSHVTANQFRSFCERIGAPIEVASPETRNLFDPSRVEEVFLTREYAFDADRLRAAVRGQLKAAGVEVLLETEVERLSERSDGDLVLHLSGPGRPEAREARHVFNCTYGRLNRLLVASGLPTMPLKYEVTEIALVEVPERLESIGVTVMCGPFFSCMPFPARGLHSLSHVRYTPHCSWTDGMDGSPDDSYEMLERAPLVTHFDEMLRDAKRYLPALEGTRYVESLWEIKALLPTSEVDDSRPILFRQAQGMRNLTCVMGGKIDNVYEMTDELARMREKGLLQ